MSDAHYDKVTLLLPMSGSNGGTVFTDYSAVSRAVTPAGNAQTSTAVSKYYGAAGLFDGAGDYLSTANGGVHDPGGADFCVEAWIYPQSADNVNTRTVITNRVSTNGWWVLWIGPANDRYVRFVATSASGTVLFDLVDSAPLPAAQWAHVAASKSGATWRLFVGGDLRATATQSADVPSTATLFVGRDSQNTARDWHGRIQDLRITKGEARYTTAFTPPTRLIGEIAGTVDDDTDVGAVRRIVAFPRLAPTRVVTTQSASDGTFTLTGLPVTEHTVVYLDDDAGTLYNDLCHRVIPA